MGQKLAASLLISALDRDERSASRPDLFIPHRGTSPRYFFYKSLSEPQSRFGRCEVEKILLLSSGTWTLVTQPVARLYTDWDIAAPELYVNRDNYTKER
jgi:hypothetical protein